MTYLKRAAYPVALFILLVALLLAGDDQNWFYFKQWMANR